MYEPCDLCLILKVEFYKHTEKTTNWNEINKNGLCTEQTILQTLRKDISLICFVVVCFNWPLEHSHQSTATTSNCQLPVKPASTYCASQICAMSVI